MFPQQEYMAVRLNDLYIEERLQEAKTIALLRQAGFFEFLNLTRFGCKGLACLGHMFVAFGHRLERFGNVSKRKYTSNHSASISRLDQSGSL